MFNDESKADDSIKYFMRKLNEREKHVTYDCGGPLFYICDKKKKKKKKVKQWDAYVVIFYLPSSLPRQLCILSSDARFSCVRSLVQFIFFRLFAAPWANLKLAVNFYSYDIQ